ncbi:MAG: hypothetical protein OEY23_26215 [Acidimicrobiia bacterium]|nr:hypothetical protein [Acidimicrobiia bacterium]
MADLAEAAGAGYGIGVLSKQAEAWVLITLARRAETLVGYSFCTLERIGGTPSVLLGCAAVARTGDQAAILADIMSDQYRRAVLAFPDEDVLVATRMARPDAFAAFELLEDIIPRPGHKASGEERAWGRRLVKRFGIEATAYDDRAFVVRGDGTPGCTMDHLATADVEHAADVAAFFEQIDGANGDVLIAFGWAMAEFLDSMLPE